MNEETRIEYVPLEQVRRWPRNPKRHNLTELNRSLERFGFVAPLLQDDRTGQLVAGHGRLEALLARRDAGKPPPKRIRLAGEDWAVPVLRGVRFDTEAEAEAYLVADNRLAEVGGWDEQELSDMLQRVTASTNNAADALSGTGITVEELDDLLRGSTVLQSASFAPRSEDMSGFLRPDFTEDVQQSGVEKPVSKDGNWFYVEFYGQDELYKQLSEKLAAHMSSKHQLAAEVFLRMVDSLGAK